MFFPEKITKINVGDRVLEIGPGGNPFSRSDVFLDINHKSNEEKLAQYGSNSDVKYNKPLYYYDGGKIPFNDNDFNYVICSHVIEHVENIPNFITELIRIAPKGYLEFPSPYYEYLYNFSVHKNFIYYNREEKIIYFVKKNNRLKEFEKCTDFFKQTLMKGYTDIIDNNKELFINYLEWQNNINIKEVADLSQINFEPIIISTKKTGFYQKVKNFIKIALNIFKT